MRARTWTRWAAAAAIAFSLAAPGCSGGNIASELAKPPPNPNKESKCGTTKIQARPLIVEWPSSDRAALEARIKQGLVPVRYIGCEMEVLTTCKVPAAYGYTGITPKNDKVVIHNNDELYANIPVHAASFEAKLATAGSLEVAMTIIGRYESDRPKVRADELQGECSAATHVITALTVGSFMFSAGANAEVGTGANVQGAGAGAKSQSSNETLNTDGDPKQCEKATSDDKTPPFGCGALLRVELVPLGEAGQGAVASAQGGSSPTPPTPPAPPTPPGTSAPASGSAAASASASGPPTGNATADAHQKSCDGGDNRACVTLGEMFYNAKGVTKDAPRAVALFKKACDSKEPTGCVDLGWAYSTGTGTEKNATTAADYFGKACNSTTAVGCVGLAGLYRDGAGVTKDSKKANDLYKQACDKGNDFACKAIKK